MDSIESARTYLPVQRSRMLNTAHRGARALCNFYVQVDLTCAGNVVILELLFWNIGSLNTTGVGHMLLST